MKGLYKMMTFSKIPNLFKNIPMFDIESMDKTLSTF